jgi:hypothetical protein
MKNKSIKIMEGHIMKMKSALFVVLSVVLSFLTFTMPVMANAATSTTSDSNLPTVQELSQLNSQALSMVLAGKASQIDSLPQVQALKEEMKNNPTLEKEYLSNLDCTKSNMKPVRTINAVIDGLPSLVQVYEDDSFTLAQTKVIRNGSAALAISNQSSNLSATSSTVQAQSSGYTTYWTATYSGLGGWEVWTHYYYYGAYIDTYMELTTDFDNYSSYMYINSESTAGSYCVWPWTLTSATGQTICNDSCDVIAEGDYNISVIYPVNIVSYVDSIRIELVKSSGSSSFTVYGEVNNNNL